LVKACQATAGGGLERSCSRQWTGVYRFFFFFFF